MMDKFKVLVRCFTYNHAKFIQETMDGFCMQQTDFPFVCAIVDDASTDGEQKVIGKYLKDYFDLEDQTLVREEETNDYTLTFARHKTNKNCFFAVFYLKYNHYSIQKPKTPYFPESLKSTKYLAICEGDDYWIDPMKLGKQVSFLESHPDYNLVYTDVNTYQQKESIMRESFFEHGMYPRRKNTHRDFILWGWFLAPCTWLFRNHVVVYPNSLDPNKFYGDIYILLCLSEKGAVHFIKSNTAVYRVQDESMSHSKDNSKKFDFWRRGLLTRSKFAAKQPMFFKMKFLVFSIGRMVKSYLDNRGLIKIHHYFSTFKDVIIELY